MGARAAHLDGGPAYHHHASPVGRRVERALPAGVKGQLADMDHSYAPPTETEDEPDVLIRLRAEYHG